MDAFTILFYVAQFGVFILALSLHEASHAFAADRFGDPTAKMLGRLSINPVRHIDPIGTILLPIFAVVARVPVIGWAKPVPVNTYNLRDPKLDHAFIAGAGPLSNLAQAGIYTIILWSMEPFSGGLIDTLLRYGGLGGAMAVGALGTTSWLFILIYMICFSGVLVNLLLAVFNLIPVPPLDGGWILGGVLPDEFQNVIHGIGQFGIIIIWFLLYLGFFNYVLYPVLNAYMGAFLPMNGSFIVSQIFNRGF